MLKTILTAIVLSTGLVFAGSAADKKADAKNCCEAKLACCGKDKACCVATTKLGCCDKGQKCCAKDAACCAMVQDCCRTGAACCDEVKACCGTAPKKESKTSSEASKDCCSAVK
jgi:hypothetical protein